MSHLSPEQIEIFGRRLSLEREKLEEEIKRLGAQPNMGDEPGPEDETDEATGYYNQQAQAHDLRGRLSKVEAALLRIEKGTYGMCQATGKEIPPDVLEVNPYIEFHPDYLKEQNISA